MNSKIQQVSNSANLAYIEALYAAYVVDPSSVDQDWRAYFAALNGDASDGQTTPMPSTSEGNGAVAHASGSASSVASRASTLQEQVNEMIRAFRSLGHKAANIDPLGLSSDPQPSLDPEFYGLTVDDMKRLFPGVGLPWNGPLTIGEIVERLRRTYCGAIGVEFMHIDEPAVRNWLQRRMEESQNHLELSHEQKLRILARLTDAVTFEEFVRKKFVGAKSFSLEGAESLIPLLDFAINHAARDGLQEIVLAMAHRGRLNVLANIIGKSPWEIFREFDDPLTAESGGGDVKYHLGYSNDYELASGEKIHLSLCFNPSHLEFVNPVAVGRMRAKQDRVGDQQHGRGMALLIHGDAAFAGEGVTQETLKLESAGGL